MNEARTDKMKDLDARANQVFKPFLESLLAQSKGQQYAPGQDDMLIRVVVDRIKEGIDRCVLAAFYFDLERREGFVRWDSHPLVREAILEIMDLTDQDYLVITGRKRYRSIDDK